MRIRICSGFSPAGRRQYGERFLASFDRHWPAQVELRVYVEEPMPMPRDACRSLWAIPGALAFEERHRDNSAIRGRAALPCWKDRERAAGYSFRTDAMKFFKQILIPQAAARDAGVASSGPLDDGDILAWIDADVETISPVPAGLIPSLLGHAELAFLGREPKHSEIGFWAVRVNPRTRAFLARMADLYASDEFLQLREFHSAFVWDHARRDPAFRMVERSLSREGDSGHVWPRTELARFMRHDKGDRKPR